MNQSFSSMLAEDGKKNSLGRVPEVIQLVLADKHRLEELYATIGDDDAWVRMRAIDAFEKICRDHPDWVEPYIDTIQRDLAASTQPSIQWHIAQIYAEVPLTAHQTTKAISWLQDRLHTPQTDWIVAANSLQTLAYFVRQGDASADSLRAAIAIQQQHTSKAVVRRATKLLATIQ